MAELRKEKIISFIIVHATIMLLVPCKCSEEYANGGSGHRSKVAYADIIEA